MNALLFCQPSRSNYFVTFLPALAKLWEVFVFVSVFVCCVVFVSNCLSIYLVTFLPALSRICVSKDVFVFASVYAFVLFCQQLPLYLPGDLLPRLGQHIEPLLSADQSIAICVSPAKFGSSSQVRLFFTSIGGTWNQIKIFFTRTFKEFVATCQNVLSRCCPSSPPLPSVSSAASSLSRSSRFLSFNRSNAMFAIRLSPSPLGPRSHLPLTTLTGLTNTNSGGH